MAVDVAHGPWCNTRTYPMRCKYCGKQIFFFSCDHGSRVFFDPPLGPPWPLHRCLGYLEATYGKEIIERGMAVMMMSPGIERNYAEQIQRAVQEPSLRQRPPQILRQDAYDGAKADELGLIREIIWDVDVYKRFEVPTTTVGAALLGELASGKWVQVTIHTAPLADEDNSSFTFLIKRQFFDKLGPITGDLVFCQLRGIRVANRLTTWVCQDIQSAMD